MLLAADQLTVSLGGRVIFEQLSLNLAAGETVLLTGPNGAGKTTLLRTLAGFLRPDAGRVRFGTDANAGAQAVPDAADVVHYIGHRDAVKPALTVVENLTFWRDYLGGTAASIDAALVALELGHLHDVLAGDLSAGQRRRLGLARLLAAARPIWLLDEPTVSLDQASRARFDAVIAAHVASGGAVIAATHEAFAAGAATRELAFTPGRRGVLAA
jgi:heme exporter protein A